MWEFPNVEVQEGISNHKQQLAYYMREAFGLEVSVDEYAATVQHSFTHRTWEIFLSFFGTAEGTIQESDTLKILTPEQFEQYTFSRSHKNNFFEDCIERASLL
ncbi:hypothetical protein GCM10020331_089170 [Ectobacillus funiculus]